MCVPILLVSQQETYYEKAWLELELHLPEDHSTHAVYTREIKKFVNTDLFLEIYYLMPYYFGIILK